MRGRKKGTKVDRKKKPYFAEVEEQAVIYYIDPQTPLDMKNRIYDKYLYIPMRKIVDGVSKKYAPYAGLLGEEELEEAAFVYLYDIMHKFSPFKLNKLGVVCKAYSYYGTCGRNWCSNYCKNTYDTENKQSAMEEVFEQFDNNLEYSYELDEIDEVDEVNIYENLMKSITFSVRNEIATNQNLKVNDLKVGEAIIAIFENWIHIYTEENKNFTDKKKITTYYLSKKIKEIIKDYTGLQSKDVKKSMKVYKSLYTLLMDEQLRDEDDEQEY